MAQTKKKKNAFKHGNYVALDLKVAGIGALEFEHPSTLPSHSILFLRFPPAKDIYIAIDLDTLLSAHGKTVEDSMRHLVYAVKNAMDGKPSEALYNWLLNKSKASADASICGNNLWDLYNEFLIMNLSKKGKSQFAGQKIMYDSTIRSYNVNIVYHIAKGCKAF